MKAILEFKLPEDKDEFTLATKGSNYYFALLQMADHFRSDLKHNDDYTHEEMAVVEKFQKEFLEILEDNNVNLDEVS